MAHWYIGSFVIDGRYIQDHFPGIGRYTYNLIDALARVVPDERFVVLYNPALKNTRYDIAALARHPNIELVRVNVPTISVSEQYRLLSAISRQPSAVGGQWSVIFHSPYYIKPYFLTVPSIVTIFDLIPSLCPHAVSLRARFFFRWAVWLAAKTSARVIVPSLATRDDLIAHLRVPREKIVVIPLAADARFAPQSDAEIARVREKYALPARYVLYVGSNKPHKNLAMLLDAWARVATDAVLVIAGAWDARYARATDDRRRMTDDASASAGGQRSAVGSRQEAGGAGQSQIANRKSQIRLIHDVNDADLPALYAGARAFVFPSLYEGFGLPVLEAMACGAPVICSRAPALPEVVGDTALLVNPHNPNEIADAIERVLTDHGLGDTLRTRGLARAAQFSWERTARETSQVYRTVSFISRIEL